MVCERPVTARYGRGLSALACLAVACPAVVLADVVRLETLSTTGSLAGGAVAIRVQNAPGKMEGALRDAFASEMLRDERFDLTPDVTGASELLIDVEKGRSVDPTERGYLWHLAGRSRVKAIITLRQPSGASVSIRAEAISKLTGPDVDTDAAVARELAQGALSKILAAVGATRPRGPIIVPAPR